MMGKEHGVVGGGGGGVGLFSFKIHMFYYSANEEWQSRDILFTIAEYIVQCYP